MKLYYAVIVDSEGAFPVAICESLEKAKASCHIYHFRNTGSNDIIEWGEGVRLSLADKQSILRGECENYEYCIFECELNEVWLK